jgi:hypothetical protein
VATATPTMTQTPRQPFVTVLVLCYNYGCFLTQCVDSVLTQDNVNLKVLIVNDASTDDTESVAAELIKRDSRVRLITAKQNLGMIPALNFGLREVDGDYFVKLDADDMLTPGSLERSIAFLEKHPNVGFVYGRPHDFRGEKPSHEPRWTLGAFVEWLITRGCPTYTLWRGSRWLELRYQRAHNCIRQPEAVIRVSVLKNAGQYNPKLRHTSDLEMWLRLAALSDVGRINGIEQGYYRIHPDSMQHTVNSGLLTDLIGRREAFLSEAMTRWIQNTSGANPESVVRNELAMQALEAAHAELDRKHTGSSQIDQFLEFALTTSPPIVTSSEWKRLEDRRNKTKEQAGWLSASIASGIRYFRHEWAYLRWFRTGV